MLHEISGVTETKSCVDFRLVYAIFGISFISNALAAIYFTSFHQVGIKPATSYVTAEMESFSNPTVWVLMPCYTIPVFT